MGGSWVPYSRVICASDHFGICRVKILEIVAPDRRMSRMVRPPTLRLYMNDVPPATIGR